MDASQVAACELPVEGCAGEWNPLRARFVVDQVLFAVLNYKAKGEYAAVQGAFERKSRIGRIVEVDQCGLPQD